MAKGVRVNLLAKELGIESKLILQKLKNEGHSDNARNHMSTLSLGMAASVREWFADSSPGGAEKNAKLVGGTPKATSAAKAQRKEDARIELVVTLQGDFESHLAAAKKAERGGRRAKKDRFVRAAIESQVAVVDGYLSLLYERYWPLPDRKRINKREKLERLCKFASQKSGSRIDPLQFHLIAFRDIFSHPAIKRSHPTIKGLVLSAAAIDENMPAPTEVEAEEIRINEFFKRLQSLLPNC